MSPKAHSSKAWFPGQYYYWTFKRWGLMGSPEVTEGVSWKGAVGLAILFLFCFPAMMWVACSAICSCSCHEVPPWPEARTPHRNLTYKTNNTPLTIYCGNWSCFPDRPQQLGYPNEKPGLLLSGVCYLNLRSVINKSWTLAPSSSTSCS